jgi:hypothetical protein
VLTYLSERGHTAATTAIATPAATAPAITAGTAATRTAATTATTATTATAASAVTATTATAATRTAATAATATTAVTATTATTASATTATTASATTATTALATTTAAIAAVDGTTATEIEDQLELLPPELAAILLRMSVGTYTACSASVVARLGVRVRADRPTADRSLLLRCRVATCDVVARVSSDASIVLFTTSNCSMVTSEDARYGVARAAEASIRLGAADTRAYHYDYRINRGLMPQPGDPAGLLSLLPAILTINAGLSVRSAPLTVTSRHVLLMCPGFLTALTVRDSTAEDVEASVHALLVSDTVTVLYL